jgi:hypothetical protein
MKENRMDYTKHAARGYEAVLRRAQSAATGNSCPVCAIKLKAGNQTSDHCHDTGLARGTLCRTCNGGEGVLRDRGEAAALRHFEQAAPPNRFTKAAMRPAARLRALKLYLADWLAVHSQIAVDLESGDLSPKLGTLLGLHHTMDWMLQRMETGSRQVADALAKRGKYLLPSGEVADVLAAVRGHIEGRLKLAEIRKALRDSGAGAAPVA